MKHYTKGAALLLAGCLLLFGGISAAAAPPLPVKMAGSGGGTLADLNLSISTEFQITRPTEKDFSTTYATFFITGTSDPSRPVYFDGEEIARQGTKGTFGVLVGLQMGSNSFTFRQGDVTQTVTITRKSAGTAISRIAQDSMFPAIHGGAKAGQMLAVSCRAPSGSAVSASFGGQTAALVQAETVPAGAPALFKGELKIGTDYNPDTTQKVGPITYTLSYGGTRSSYQSSGNMYIAGQNSRVIMRVSSYQGFVYPNFKNKLVMQNLLSRGALDYIKGQTNEYFVLSSGGVIPTDMVEILEGNFNISNRFSSAAFAAENRGESYAFAGTTRPAYKIAVTDTAFQITFYNTTGAPAVPVGSSRLFASCASSASENSVTYTFSFANKGRMWGYHVAFDGNNTVLRFRYRPSLSDASTGPLTGITVLVDPGHGGSDPGALGVAGAAGPSEKTINLAHAYAVRDALQAMGARVYLTRSTDIRYELDERLKDIETCNADFFISLHHNSMSPSGDANKASGVEMYYHTPYSKRLAQSMAGSVSNGLSRTLRGSFQSYYRVTLMPYCPAVLMEMGFMSNPLEYERLTDTAQIKAAAQAVANGVVAALK